MSTYLSFGPSSYPVIDLIANRSNDSDAVAFTAIKKSARAPVKLWSYKFDTLSIPSRTLVAHLNETLYPPCVMYRSECDDPLWLAPATAFGMMDGLIDAIDHELHHEDPQNHAPLVFMTKNVWIDRLHHFLVSPFSTHVQTRLHHAYHFRSGDNRPLRLCAPPERRRHKHTGAYQRPMFCDLVKYWKCPELILGKSFTILPHIAARFALLQRQHPDLDFDVTMFTTQRISTNRYTWNSLVHPQAFLRHTASEVTTWMRGRKCANGDCVTMFLSDYRYEIATIDHNAAEWFPITGTLRAYMTRLVEPQSASRTYAQFLGRAWQTFLFIPAQALVYGSWVPVLAHALAHTIDGCLIHYCGEGLWATVDAAKSAPILTQVQRMSIQMRNTWYVALVLQVWVNVLQHRQVPWRHMDGVRGLREMVVGAVSALTVFASIKNPTFRDSRVVERRMLPHKLLSPYSTGLEDGYAMAVGPWFDMKALFLSSCVVLLCVMALLLVAKLSLLALCRRNPRFRKKQQEMTLVSVCDVLFPHTHYVPLSAGFLWSVNMFAVHWRPRRCDEIVSRAALMEKSTTGQDSVRPFASGPSLPLGTKQGKAGESVSGPSLPPLAVAGTARRRECAVCVSGLGCNKHEPIYEVQHRTTMIWSIFRVLNLAMMTDPLVFIQLRFFGRRFSPSGVALPKFIILPAGPKVIEGLSSSHSTHLKLMREVMSTDIEWEHLLLCG
ncbi:TPA: hypothetical protein N0F65_004624 [Lagenidium giganteum]|uniref:Uncharacterized protein n=1 Tax=Lagenidium giganteum TaxID=4803 RepID=A0AAV2ZCR5_9STRA|nr:TPA: hypothetical protein N0F65_004624 [Lagenidium giganteum]